MQKFSRRIVLAAIGALALVGAMQFSPAVAQIDPGPSVKGKWKGTFQSSEGNGTGNIAIKITKDKDRGGGRQLKGNGKFGNSGNRKLTGVSSTQQVLISLMAKGRNSESFQLSGQVSKDGKTISGNYQVQQLQGVGQPPKVTDEGTFSISK